MSLLTMSAQLAEGFLITVEIFVLTLLFSLPLGLIVAFGRMSGCKVIRIISKIYISIMRGTPLMLQLMVVYFGPYFIFGIRISMGYSLIAVFIAFAINYAAYFAEIYRGGIESMPVGQYEAAEILGYGKVQTFFKITVPLLKPMILLTTITSTNGTLQLFDESLNLTNGGPGKSTMTMSHYIYNMSFVQSPNFGYAAAMSILILIMVAILALIQMKVGDER